MSNELRFFWNGLKVGKGKLHRCFYHLDKRDGSIGVSARGYGSLPKEVADAFGEIRNDTDLMTDYFDNDRFRVKVDHPLYAKVKAACAAVEEHYTKLREKRAARKTPPPACANCGGSCAWPGCARKDGKSYCSLRCAVGERKVG